MTRWTGRLLAGLATAALLALGTSGVAAGQPAAAQQPAGGSPVQQARAAWDAHGRPNRMIIVRAATVDTVIGGALAGQVPRPAGAPTLAGLAGAVPAGWITTDAAATRVSAAVLLTPGVDLDLGGGPRTVRLTGGPAAADASWIHTGGGRLTANEVTVTSVDPATGWPLPQGPGRPYVSVGTGGRLEARDATFADLGTPTAEPGGRPGVGFGAGSTGSLLRTKLLHNSTGLRLDGSTGVRLEWVQVGGASADGLVLRGDRGTALTEVRAEYNVGNGVLVDGPSSDRPITGVTTMGNRQFGVAVVNQAGPRVAGVVTQRDGAGGLQLAGATDAAVSGFSAIDQPTGVLVGVGSTRVALDDLRITGGDRGLVTDKTTAGLVVSAARIDHAETGVTVAGQNVELRAVEIADSRSGVRIERGSGDITATGLRISGGQDGVVALAGTTGLALRDLVTERVAGYGVRTASSQARIIGGRITGSETGIAADAATTITGTEITDVKIGILARSTELVTADGVTVSASASGVTAEAGSRPVTLTGSQVRAEEAVSGPVNLVGHNDLSLPPLNLLSVIGIPLVLLALVLDQVQRFRARRRAGG